MLANPPIDQLLLLVRDYYYYAVNICGTISSEFKYSLLEGERKLLTSLGKAEMDQVHKVPLQGSISNEQLPERKDSNQRNLMWSFWELPGVAFLSGCPGLGELLSDAVAFALPLLLYLLTHIPVRDPVNPLFH